MLAGGTRPDRRAGLGLQLTDQIRHPFDGGDREGVGCHLQTARNSGRVHGSGTMEALSHALWGLVTGWAVQKALLGQCEAARAWAPTQT